MALTEADKERARYHLAYSSISTPVSLSLGDIAVTQARFIVDRHLSVLNASAEPFVIRTLDRLDCIEQQIDEVRASMITIEVGSTKFREDADLKLLLEYERYQRRLADQLAAQVNPVSNERMSGQGGVIEGGW